MMWEYIVIIFLSIVDMVTGQSSSIPILTKASLQSAVNSWCSTSGSSAQRDAQFSTGLGATGSGCSPRNKCYGPIADWNTSQITDMSGLFDGKSSCNPAIGKWDVSRVTTMEQMFYDSSFNADISGWRVSSTCDLTMMFNENNDFCPAAGFGCDGWANTAITQAEIPGCTVDFTCSDNKLRSLNIRDAIRKLYGSSVAARNAITSMYGVIANWDTAYVTNMENLFKSIPSTSRASWNADLSNWDTSRVITMKRMFNPTVGSGPGLSAFNSVLAAWNVGNVLNMESMFENAVGFNSDISQWIVRKVTNMIKMFSGAITFNRDLPWNAGELTTMQSMFDGATQFNGDISLFNVIKVVNMEDIFKNAKSFAQGTWCSASWKVSPFSGTTMHTACVVKAGGTNAGCADASASATTCAAVYSANTANVCEFTTSRVFCCPIGKYVKASTDVVFPKSDCTRCPTGKAQGTESLVSACTDCPRDSIAPAPGLSVCAGCSINRCVVKDGGSNDDCMAETNARGNTNAAACAAATVSGNGGNSANDCVYTLSSSTYYREAIVEYTLTINTADITKSSGVVVTQDGNTGTLKNALTGAETEIVVILGDADDTFSSSKDLIIDSTNPVTVLADDITAVNQALQSAPSNFGFGNVFSNGGGDLLPGEVSRSTCKTCPAGQWMDTSGANTVCKDCASGTFQADSTGAGFTSCDDCPKGYYQDAQRSPFCLPCNPGKTNHQLGQKNCLSCVKGQYMPFSASEALTCKNCISGQYGSGVGGTSCESCPPGTYSTVVASDALSKCGNCSAGTYSSAKGVSIETDCIRCQPGKIGTEAGQTNSNGCQDCPPNYSRDDAKESKGRKVTLTDPTICSPCENGRKSLKGSANCFPCPAGEHGAGVGLDCVACEVGQFRFDQTNTIACKVCDLGTYMPITGASACLSCPVGQVQLQTGQSKCEDCLAGSYRGTTDNANEACVPCAAGYYQEDAGQGQCLPCIPSSFNALTGRSEKCQPCAENTFSSSTTATSCDACGIGEFSEEGSAKCTRCGAGTYGNGCLPCPLETARNSSDPDVTQCRQCKLGETTTIEGAAVCDKCDLGKYGSSPGVCTECIDKKQYQDTKGETKCLSCTLGEKWTSLISSCTKCTLGQYGSSPGECIDCKPGMYQDGKGLSECIECPVDTYLSEEGKSSNTECKECDSNRSTGELIGNIHASACKCRRSLYYSSNSICLKCPPGADCNARDDVTITELSALPGYWRSDLTSTDFGECKVVYKSVKREDLARERCCPSNILCNTTVGTAVTNVTLESTWNPDTQCKQGYRGVMCGECDNDHVRLGENCNFCLGGSSITGAIISMLTTCFILFLSAFIVLKKISALTKDKGTTTKDKIAAQVKILASWLQIFSTLTKTFDSVPWGDSFTGYSQGSGSVVNLDISWFTSSAVCSLSLPFLQQFAVSAVFPICVYIAIKSATYLAMLGVVNTTENPNRREAKGAESYVILIMLIMMLFPSIANKSFTVFRCTEIDGLDYQVLNEDFSVECWANNPEKGYHLTYIAVAIACIIVYAFGIPFGIFIQLYRNREHFHATDSIEHHVVHSTLGNFYTQFEEKYWFWEIGNLLFKLAITGVLCILAPGTPFQVMCAVILCLINMMCLLRWSPYESFQADVLSMVCASCLALTVLGGYVALANETMFTVTPKNLDIGLVVLNSLPLPLFLWNIILLIKDHKKTTKELPQTRKSKSIEMTTKVQPVNSDSALKTWEVDETNTNE